MLQFISKSRFEDSLKIYVLALVSVFLGTLVFYAFPPYNYSFYYFIPYIYLFLCIKFLSTRLLLLASFSLGCGIFFRGMFWLYDFSAAIDPNYHYSVVIINSIILLLLALFSTTIPSILTSYSAKILNHTNPFFLAVLIFTLFEWIRSTLFTGLPYYQPGYILIDTPFSKLAPVGGVLSMTFVFFCMVSAVLSFCFSRGKSKLISLGGMLLIVLATALLNMTQWSQDSENLDVRIIHGTSSNADKEDFVEMHQRINRYLEYTFDTNDNSVTPELVIWPEGSVTSAQGMYRKIRKSTEVLHAQGTKVLFGGYPEDYQNKYNALLSAENLKIEYRKYHLIPFGEYTPDIPIPFLNLGQHLPEIDNSSLTKGPKYQPVSTLGKLKFRAGICFELIFGDELRVTASDYDVFIHISDLGWFNGTPVAFHMLQMARMRAIELSKPVLRATNFGISSVIDHRGQVLGQINEQVEQYFDVNVTSQKGLTPYVRFGSTPLVWGLLVVYLILVVRRIALLNYKSKPYLGWLEKKYE